MVSEKYKDVQIILASWWNNIDEETISAVYNDVPFPGYELSHAEVMETSMVMYFEPELVDLTRLVDEGHDEVRPYYIFPTPDDFVPDSGLNARAYGSTAEKGKILVKKIIDNFTKICDLFE